MRRRIGVKKTGRRLYEILFIVMLLAVTLFVSAYFYSQKTEPRNEVVKLHIPEEDVSDIIGTQEDMRQYFVPNRETVGLQVKFATYEGKPRITYDLTVYDALTDSVVDTCEIKPRVITDHAYTNIYFHRDLEKGREYYFTIQKTRRTKDAISVYMSTNDVYADGYLLSNGQDVGADLDFNLIAKGNSGGKLLIYWIVLGVLLLLCVYHGLIPKRAVVATVYLCLFGILIFQFVYNLRGMNLGHFDETAHISYLAYLTQTGKLIPDFKEMTLLVPSGYEDAGSMQGVFYFFDQTIGIFSGSFTSTVAYLGHSPFYYWLMLPLRAVSFSGDVVYVHLLRLRLFNMALGILGMILCGYIGFTRIPKNKPLYHLLFGSLCIALPYCSYLPVTINNDNLLWVSVPLFLLGFIRLCEKRYNYATYFIFGAGLTITLMTKLTMGMVVVLMAVFLAGMVIFKDRSPRILRNRAFLLSCVLYILPLCYYGFTYMKYGAFQPELQLLVTRDVFKDYTMFYQPKNIVHQKNLWLEFYNYFLKDFFANWGYDFDSYKTPAIICWMRGLLWLIPLSAAFGVIKVRKRKLYFRPERIYSWALFIAVIFQGYIAIQSMLQNGHAGTQSRYYMPLLVCFAFDVVWRLKRFDRRYAAGIEDGGRLQLRGLIIAAAIIAIHFWAFGFYLL